MPFNGSGTFDRVYSWAQDALNGLFISSSRMDTEMNGFATGLTNCLTRDGQSPPTADIPMNGFKITGLAPGVSSTDAATVGQVVTSTVGSIFALGNSGAGFNFDPANGRLQYVTLSASSICTLVNPAVVTNTGWYYLKVTNNGGFTLNFAGASYSAARWWDHDAAPSVNALATSVTWFAFFWDGVVWQNLLIGLISRRKNYFVQAFVNGGSQATVAGVSTKIKLNAIGFDPYGEFDTTNYRWIPEHSGVYQVNLVLQVQNASAAAMNVQVTGNLVGTLVSEDERAIAAATNQLMSLNFYVQVTQANVAAGYYLEAYFLSVTGAGTIQESQSTSFINIARIGDVE